MPRPHTKELLLSESHQEREKLEKFLTTLTPDQMIQSDIVAEWSIKDVLAHLYEWEQMVLRWLAAGQRGKTAHVPAEGNKWNQLPALNEEIRQKYLRRSLDEVQAMFKESYHKTMEDSAAKSHQASLPPYIPAEALVW